jgi:plasmid stabilization system protein ParE
VKRRLIIRQQAEADIAAAATWYQRAGLGQDFLLTIQSALDEAALHPHRFRRLRRRPEVRRVLLKRFPYRVFFILETDRVVVFRVLHSVRHDREWKHNLGDS